MSFRHPVKVVVVSVLLALMGVILALFRLEINVDRAALVDSEGRLERLSRNYQREFPNSDEMVVVVEGGGGRPVPAQVTETKTISAGTIPPRDH